MIRMIALILVGLLVLATGALVIANVDGPPPGVPGCQISSDSRGHSIGILPSSSPPLKCFAHP